MKVQCRAMIKVNRINILVICLINVYNLSNIALTFIIFFMKEDDQIKQHKQKLLKWNQQRQREQAIKKMQMQEGIEKYAVNLIQKIGGAGISNSAATNKINKQITNQIQSNVCSVCLELMVPPEHHPVILFPCGHNICKDCLFQRPPPGPIGKNMRLKIAKCTICRQKIESYALNRSLMTLICTYTDNKDLLEKEIQEQQAQQEINAPQIQQLRIRCDYLEQQKINLSRSISVMQKEKKILFEVVETLKKQKKRNQAQMKRLQQQAQLIEKHLHQKLQQLEFSQKKIKQAVDKQNMVDRALAPLQKEKEKIQLLEFARLVSKKA